jgi:hypothetical protein
MVHFDIGPDLRERDIIEVYSGPSAPKAFEIEALHPPRGHHLQARTIVYQGKLPEVES